MLSPSSLLISTSSSDPFPLTSLIEYFVNKLIIFFWLSSLIFLTLAGAPLNSSLLCISETFEVLDSSIAQSSALSPPPKIATDLFLKIVLSLIEYRTEMPSNFQKNLLRLQLLHLEL